MRIFSKITTPKRFVMGGIDGAPIIKPGLVASLVHHCFDLKRLSKTIRLRLKQQVSPTMSHQAVTEYLLAIVEKYQASSKNEKTNILNHAQLVTGRSRKQLIRRLRQDAQKLRQQSNAGRPLVYSKTELQPHLHYLWNQMERISARRMKAGFADWLPKYKNCPAHLRLQLQRISASTIERYLSEVRGKCEPRKGLSTTSPARYFKNKVPINTLDEQIEKPGHVQADTVAHCGTSSLGPFISSLTVTDVYSAWTGNHALFTKRQAEVYGGFKAIEKELPFDLVALNTDSGSEFLNTTMWRFTGYGKRIKFTRSRPYKKNDNCYVEQKNFTHVRELFGYERLEEENLVALMNEIYHEYWNPLHNYFIPTFKLKKKERIGSRIKKTYGKPQTPYQRLMASEHLTSSQKETLQAQKLRLDPFGLKRGLEIKLKEFFDLVRKNNIRKAS